MTEDIDFLQRVFVVVKVSKKKRKHVRITQYPDTNDQKQAKIYSIDFDKLNNLPND